MAGDGLYIYQNITGADLLLPRPTKAGRLSVGPREKFVGDSYYKMMREVICLQEVQAPMSQTPPEEQLLTEVPPIVTHEGKVEYVKQPVKATPINEEEKKMQQPQPDVLLTETPLEGIRIMR